MCWTTGMELQLTLAAGAWSPVPLTGLSSVCMSKNHLVHRERHISNCYKEICSLSDGNDDLLQRNSKPKSLWKTLSEHRELDKSSEPVSTTKHAF